MDSLETSAPVGRIDGRAPPRPARSVDDMRGYGTMRASRGHQHETITKPSLSSSPVPTQPTTLRNFGGTSSPAADSSPLSSSLSSSGANRPTPPPKPRTITSTLRPALGSSSSATSLSPSPRTTAPPGRITPLQSPQQQPPPNNQLTLRRVAPIPPPTKALPPQPPLTSSSSTASPAPSPIRLAPLSSSSSAFSSLPPNLPLPADGASPQASPARPNPPQRPVTMQPVAKKKGSKRLPPPPAPGATASDSALPSTAEPSPSLSSSSNTSGQTYPRLSPLATSGASPAATAATAPRAMTLRNFASSSPSASPSLSSSLSASSASPVGAPKPMPGLGLSASLPAQQQQQQSNASSSPLLSSSSPAPSPSPLSTSSSGVSTLRRPPRPTPPPAYTKGAQLPPPTIRSPTGSPLSSPSSSQGAVATRQPATVAVAAETVGRTPAQDNREVGAITDKLGTFIRRLENVEKQPQLQPQQAQPEPQPQPQPQRQFQVQTIRHTQSQPILRQPPEPALSLSASQVELQQRTRSRSQPQPSNLSPQQQHRQLILQSFVIQAQSRQHQQPAEQSATTSLHHSHPLPLHLRQEEISVARRVTSGGALEKSPGGARPLTAQDRNVRSADDLWKVQERGHNNEEKAKRHVYDGATEKNEAKQQHQQPQEEDGVEGLNRTYRVLYDFTGSSASELTIQAGWIVKGGETGNGWLEATYAGKFGFVPFQYVQEIDAAGNPIETKGEEPVDEDDYYTDEEFGTDEDASSTSSSASTTPSHTPRGNAPPPASSASVPTPTPAPAPAPAPTPTSTPAAAAQPAAMPSPSPTQQPRPPVRILKPMQVPTFQTTPPIVALPVPSSPRAGSPEPPASSTSTSTTTSSSAVASPRRFSMHPVATQPRPSPPQPQQPSGRPVVPVARLGSSASSTTPSSSTPLSTHPHVFGTLASSASATLAHPTAAARPVPPPKPSRSIAAGPPSDPAAPPPPSAKRTPPILSPRHTMGPSMPLHRKAHPTATTATTTIPSNLSRPIQPIPAPQPVEAVVTSAAPPVTSATTPTAPVRGPVAMPSNFSGSFHERMAHLLMRNMAGQKPDALCRSAAAVSDDDDDNDDESEDEIDAEECDEEGDEGKVWVKALGSYGAHEDGELSLKQGELILLLDYDGEDESGWWEAEKQDGSKGLVPASHVALCDSQGNLKDPLDAVRFGAQSTPDDDNDNNGGDGDVGDGKKRGGWRERIERKRQEMVSRRIERERGRLSGDTSEAAIRQAVLDEESGYVRAIHSHRTRAKDQLSFKKGAIIYVTEMKEDENVLFGTIINKKKLKRKPKSGWFPANYTILTDPPS